MYSACWSNIQNDPQNEPSAHFRNSLKSTLNIVLQNINAKLYNCQELSKVSQHSSFHIFWTGMNMSYSSWYYTIISMNKTHFNYKILLSNDSKRMLELISHFYMFLFNVINAIFEITTKWHETTLEGNVIPPGNWDVSETFWMGLGTCWYLLGKGGLSKNRNIDVILFYFYLKVMLWRSHPTLWNTEF